MLDTIFHVTSSQFKDEAELPALPPVVEDYYILPNGIRPVMQHTRIEVLTWGVRNMKKFNMSAINNPSIEIECAGMVASTNKIKNCKKNPNFDETSFYFDVVSSTQTLMKHLSTLMW